MMDSTAESRHVTAKAEEITGDRHCYGCLKYRPIEQGKFVIDVRGQKRWRCNSCTGKATFNRKGSR